MDRHRPAATASEAALFGVAAVSTVAVSAVMTPTGSAGVNPNAAGAYVHALSEDRRRRSGSQRAHHRKRSERCLNPHRASPCLFLPADRNPNGAALVPRETWELAVAVRQESHFTVHARLWGSDCVSCRAVGCESLWCCLE